MLEDNEEYIGHENRSGVERRSGNNRREMIRFEPDKEDRRKGTFRRKMKSVWDDGHSDF